MKQKDILDLLREEPKPIKLGNSNKSGACRMCGRTGMKALYSRKVGRVELMICGNCKGIMDM